MTGHIHLSAADGLSLIQQLQHRDLPLAEERTRQWLRTALDIDATKVTLRPQATSLNSFNGIVVINGEEQFFKSHTETDGAITEYYNAAILEEAGYNIVRPLRTEHRDGQQIVFYPVIEDPILFDLAREAEQGGDATDCARVIAAEEGECSRLMEIYQQTAEAVSPGVHAQAPIHQLFWHRLTGGRFAKFYQARNGYTAIQLYSETTDEDVRIDAESVPMSEVLTARWTINGVEQARTLKELIDEAGAVLNPNQATLTVIGHGDAHYGNVFLDSEARFLYFDPAFAGRHSPVLDMVKPLFHNVFAQWLYFPDEFADHDRIEVDVWPGRVSIEYQDVFTALRRDLLRIKMDCLVNPVLGWLGAENQFSHGRRPLELALMCCPLLTMNLTDVERFPPPVNWLGLALALQMGNWDAHQEFAFP